MSDAIYQNRDLTALILNATEKEKSEYRSIIYDGKPMSSVGFKVCRSCKLRFEKCMAVRNYGSAEVLHIEEGYPRHYIKYDCDIVCNAGAECIGDREHPFETRGTVIDEEIIAYCKEKYERLHKEFCDRHPGILQSKEP